MKISLNKIGITKNSQTYRVLEKIERQGGKTYVVGGTIRDYFFNAKSKDLDIEVFGISARRASDILSSVSNQVKVVGKFSIITARLDNDTVEFSFPRKSRVPGQTVALPEMVADMTIEEACMQRDFTMNSMALSFDGTLIDEYGGVRDIKNRVLRYTSKHTFADDPMRVIRAMQFLSRFCLTPDKELIQLSRNLSCKYSGLDSDRFLAEWRKWAKGNCPASGIKFLHLSDWMVHFPFGELGFPVKHIEFGRTQNPLTQTLDSLTRITPHLSGWDNERRLILLIATLFQNVGKVASVANSGGAVATVNYDTACVNKAELFMKSVHFNKSSARRVTALLLWHANLRMGKIDDTDVIRMANDLHPVTIDDWYLFVKNIYQDHPNGDYYLALIEKIYKVAQNRGVNKNKPPALLKGQDLLDLGFPPGKELGGVLDMFRERQLNGEITNREQALSLLRDYLAERG